VRARVRACAHSISL